MWCAGCIERNHGPFAIVCDVYRSVPRGINHRYRTRTAAVGFRSSQDNQWHYARRMKTRGGCLHITGNVSVLRTILVHIILSPSSTCFSSSHDASSHVHHHSSFLISLHHPRSSSVDPLPPSSSLPSHHPLLPPPPPKSHISVSSPGIHFLLSMVC